MHSSDILAEKSTAGAADKSGDPFNGTFPKGRLDGRIVDGADQITQPLPIGEIA